MTSKIKVDNIENQCGGAVVTKCGGTTTISGSVVKSNAIQASDGGNLVNQSGTTITLGASGDTINLASGASQSGFGRTGTVDWDTTPKTGTFTAVSGNGYFVDTSGAVSTANLPAGVAGAIVSFADYTRTFQTNNLTITANGSEKIGGVTDSFVAQTEGQSITLIYVDATEGWINTAESTGQSGLVPTFITATGGTITTVDTDYKVHTFTGPGTFTVSSAGNPVGSTTVDYMVIAGGGGGGNSNSNVPGGGGGAGGYRESSGVSSGTYTISPLGACVSSLPVEVSTYPIAIGGAGAAGGSNGSNSTFSTITSTGGGGAGDGSSPGSGEPGNTGGSGGGGGTTPQTPDNGLGGAGNTPPVSPAQGTAGGGGFSFQGHSFGSGAGGGATAAGAAGGPSTGGTGGAGGTSSINGTPTGRAGGGGGAGRQPLGGNGNAGSASDGGGAGGNAAGGQAAGTTNTGGGGGGNAGNGSGKAGGSGIVIIRYKFQ